MTRLNHFSMAVKAAEYVCPATDGSRVCGRCEHLTAKVQWKRCDHGGFFVQPKGTCRHFTPKEIASDDARDNGLRELVQIGPTDV